MSLNPLQATLSIAFLAASSRAGADLELPAIFGHGMVLQRESQAAVWGRAASAERVTVRIAGDVQRTVAGSDGEWIVRLNQHPAGGPHRLSIEGHETELVFEDVFFGEVWIGAGQSNMGLPVQDCNPTANDLTRRSGIRVFQQQSLPSAAPQWHGDGRWDVCARDSIQYFSGTLFYFGKTLHEQLDVPVGLIQASVGGTRIQSWISREAQHAHPLLAPSVLADEAEYAAFDIEAERRHYRRRLARWKKENPEPRSEHTRHTRPKNRVERHLRMGDVGGLFNGKIAPLIPFTIRGVVWYQGENNVWNAGAYRIQLPLLVQDWRERWGLGNFPFAWVQLPNFVSLLPDADWPGIREAMRHSLSEPNTGMAIAIDIGDPVNIHPRNKQDVGKRLAAWALGAVYERDVAISGPLPRGHRIEGSRVIVDFDHTDGGLEVRGPRLEGFELAGPDGTWFPAEARVAGETVEVRSGNVPVPTRVRYAFADDPVCNLYNGAGLPASPFTSEDWPPLPEGGSPAPR